MAYIVCIDGNIAAGKTTVLQEIEKKGYKNFYAQTPEVIAERIIELAENAFKEYNQ